MTKPSTSAPLSGKDQAMALAEASRDAFHESDSFVAGLFMGQLRWEELHPFPQPEEEDADRAEAFLADLDQFLKTETDPDTIDATGEIPQAVLDGLAQRGVFGIKIPREYGGLGFSQTTYARAARILGGWCGNLTALVSAHQSIGIPQPLLLFGTDEQKQRYLPRCARGEISAFALTEPGVGSDPARMSTTATWDDEKQLWHITGEKLWCTNGTKAGLMVVMARTPEPDDPPGRARITAFIVEANSPGLTVTTRCHFMGLRALYNGVITFDRVAVPAGNILLAEGKGLKVALSTLNTGRLTLPAACAGLLGRCLHIQRTWASERVQWGAPVGHHAAVAERIARTVTDLAVTEAITAYTCARVDRHVGDIRLEAAMAKLWGTEAGWRGVDATMQVRGGRGYETAASQKNRGEDPEPVERLFRDARINTIFEGSTEIMHLFIAREALDPHLRLAGDLFLPGTTGSGKLRIVARALRFYPVWWLGTWIPRRLAVGDLHPDLARAVRRAERGSRRLARYLFGSMLRFGPKLEREQLRLARLVGIGTALFGQCAVVARAHAQGLQHPERTETERAVALAACDQLDREIECCVAGLRHTRSDRIGYRTARKALDGELSWME